MASRAAVCSGRYSILYSGNYGNYFLSRLNVLMFISYSDCLALGCIFQSFVFYYLSFYSLCYFRTSVVLEIDVLFLLYVFVNVQCVVKLELN